LTQFLLCPLYRRALGEANRRGAKHSVEARKNWRKKEFHPKYLSEVERGTKTISVDGLTRIAKALDVRIKDLVDEL
jgi:transcriptional regulator with XRE-family HTH domain